MRHERRLDDLRLGLSPDDPGQHPHVTALDQPEAAGSARDLGDLPGVEIAPLDAVELRRLGEEQRFAGQVDAVPEHVRGGAEIGLPVQESVDLDAARGERHRAVENGHPAGVAAVQLAREREDGAATERDDDSARPESVERDLAGPVERRLALEEADLASGKAFWTSGRASTAPSRRMCRYSPASRSRVHAEPRSSSSAHWISSSTSTSPRSGAISAVQQMIGASSLTRSSPVTRPTRSAPSCAELPVRLLSEHPQRRGEDAATGLGEELERGMGLPGVRRAEMRDDALGLGAAGREPDLRLGQVRRAMLPGLARRAARPLLAAAAVFPSRRHGVHGSGARRRGSA